MSSENPKVSHLDTYLVRLANSLRDKTYCEGTLSVSPDNLYLYYGKDQNARRLNLHDATDEELVDLASFCEPATFGRNDQDVLDESYRKAGKLDLQHFSSTFQLHASDLLEIISPEFVVGRKDLKYKIKAELYKLNVYSQGGFFKSHKDTPRARNMFGSLVVAFPTFHKGGELVLRHKGQERVHNSAELLSGSKTETLVSYVAFYSDVDHEVLPVTAGHRITLTYNLYLVRKTPVALQKDLSITYSCEASIRTIVSELLKDPSVLPDGGHLGLWLAHQYAFFKEYDSSGKQHHEFYKFVDYLKGSDGIMFDVCHDLSLQVYPRVVYETDIATVMLDHFARPQEYEYEGEAALVEDLEGTVISATGEYRESMRGKAVVNVHWINRLKPLNRIKTDYISYGNQAILSELYGNVCLIIEIGEFGARQIEDEVE